MNNSIKLRFYKVLSFLVFYLMMVNVSFVNGDSLFFMGIWNNSDHTTFLGKYDPRISSLTTILTPFTSYTYLKFSPDGVLYGASGTSLCAIDSTTGESTNSVTLNDGESAIICCGITFKPDGTMYIHEYSNRTGTWLHKLYSGHPATGTLTFIANITGVTGLYGIEYANGVLYGAYDNALYSINETTGARTLMVHFAAAWVSRSSWDFSGWG